MPQLAGIEAADIDERWCAAPKSQSSRLSTKARHDCFFGSVPGICARRAASTRVHPSQLNDIAEFSCLHRSGMAVA
jgi:hypothetical protein